MDHLHAAVHDRHGKLDARNLAGDRLHVVAGQMDPGRRKVNTAGGDRARLDDQEVRAEALDPCDHKLARPRADGDDDDHRRHPDDDPERGQQAARRIGAKGLSALRTASS